MIYAHEIENPQLPFNINMWAIMKSDNVDSQLYCLKMTRNFLVSAGFFNLFLNLIHNAEFGNPPH